MERIEIINKVLARIDELTPPNSEVVAVGLVNSNPIGSIIEEILDESLLFLLKNSNSIFIPQEKCESQGVDGYVPLPETFVRLVSFKATNWEIEVREVSIEDYRTHNPHLRSGACKPKCYLSKKGGNNVLLYLGEEVEYFYYVPQIRVEKLDDNLSDILCWVCASKALSIMGLDNSKILGIINNELG